MENSGVTRDGTMEFVKQLSDLHTSILILDTDLQTGTG